MNQFIHKRIARHALKISVALVFLGFAGLAFASMGGEKRNKKSTTLRTDFVPLRTSSGFTLKAGPTYKGSLIFRQEKSAGHLSFNSLVTYQKGNTTYIMPLNHRINLGASGTGNNMQLLKLKVRMHK